MTADHAAKILELAPHATPEEIASRYDELRTRLEDRIAKAPTPGLKEKYRHALDELTQAVETLTLAADTAHLPVLRRGEAAASGASRAVAPAPAPAVPAPQESRAGTPPPQKKHGRGTEFALVALIAVLVLGAGGWWVMKTRADNAERARLESLAKAEADRVAALEKRRAEDEKARLDALNATLRAQLAELRIKWDTFEREAQSAERRATDLKSDLRSARDLAAPERAELEARALAHQSYVDWLQPYLLRHAAKPLLAKIDALLSARALDDAAKVMTGATEMLTATDVEIETRKRELLATTSPLRIDSQPAGLAFELRDSYGRARTGRTPAEVVAPFGATTVKIKRDGWPEQVREIVIRRGAAAEARAEFVGGSVRIASEPAGLHFDLFDVHGNNRFGTTPAQLTDVPPGTATIEITRAGWPKFTGQLEIKRGETASSTATFPGGQLEITSAPSGAEVYSGGTKIGATPLTLPDVAPGAFHAELRLAGHLPRKASLNVRPEKNSLHVEMPKQASLVMPDFAKGPRRFRLVSTGTNETRLKGVKPVASTYTKEETWEFRGTPVDGLWREVSGKNPRENTSVDYQLGNDGKWRTTSHRGLTGMTAEMASMMEPFVPSLMLNAAKWWPREPLQTGATWDVPVSGPSFLLPHVKSASGKVTAKVLSVSWTGDAWTAEVEYAFDLEGAVAMPGAYSGPDVKLRQSGVAVSRVDLMANYVASIRANITCTMADGSTILSNWELTARPL